MERGESSNWIAHGWSPHGSDHVRLALGPGETREVIFLLGYWENPRAAKFDPPGSGIVNKALVRPVIDRWLRPGDRRGGFRAAAANRGRPLLTTLRVDTPDRCTNRMVNISNSYQCLVTFEMSRSVSLFESGIGRGMGFRDSNQDLLGFVAMAPGRARARILDLAATQLRSGGAYHQFQPLPSAATTRSGRGSTTTAVAELGGGPPTAKRPAISRFSASWSLRRHPGATGSRSTWCGRCGYTLTGWDRTGCRSSAVPTGTTA